MATRRLSAVLHADLSGFSRLMEGSEERTVDHLKSVRAEVWRPAIEKGGGNVVDMAGDSVLVEFSSAVAAVETAIEIQDGMRRFNAPLEEHQRLMFRIGLHLGEVIVEQESSAIYGEGVNMAARIQGLAAPGGIAVSRAVRDLTETKIEQRFVDGGEHQVKNISRPLQVFHLLASAGEASDTTSSLTPAAMLRFRGADKSGRRFSFDVAIERLVAEREGLTIGRDFERCAVVVSHATVSRRHARLLLADGAVQIEDLDSTNGTSVDGKPARPGERHPVRVGTRIKLGEIDLAVERD